MPSTGSVQLSDPVNSSFFVRLQASFKNMLEARAVVSDRRPQCYESNELFSTSIASESHSTSFCDYAICSSAVLTIILLEIRSFQIFLSPGGHNIYVLRCKCSLFVILCSLNAW